MTKPLVNSTQAVRLGAISFINALPIYYTFQPPAGLDVIYDVPAQLNQKILKGELEVSPVSSVCYLQNQEALILLEDLSISSQGPVESVLFFSQVPLEQVADSASPIAVPSDSETSVELLAVLFNLRFGAKIHPRMRIYAAKTAEAALAAQGNALVIGDKALQLKAQLAEAGKLYYCYDLAELWKEQTGLPFVFAVWVARKTWAQQNPTICQELNQVLIQARNDFFQTPSLFQAGVEQAARQSGLPLETIRHYYQDCLQYSLSNKLREGLSRFESEIHALQAASLSERAAHA